MIVINDMIRIILTLSRR